MKKALKFIQSWQERRKNYVNGVLIVVKLGLISHLVLGYSLLTLSMLLLIKICSIAQDLKLLHFSGKQHVNWTYISFINVHFKFSIQADCRIKRQNNVFGKSQDYYATMPRHRKTSTSWKLVEGSTWQKKSSLLTKVKYVLALLRTIIRTILVTCFKPLRSIPIMLPQYADYFFYHCLCFWEYALRTLKFLDF